MNRLQKKCLIATAGSHLLLIVALLCSGFIKSTPKADNVPLLDVIPENVVEAALNSGVRNPSKPPPEPVKPPAPQPEKLPPPEPPKVQPPPEKVPAPEPPKPEKTADPEVKVVVKPPPPKPVKPGPVIDLKVVVKNPTKPPVKETTAQDEAQAEILRLQRIREAKLKAIAKAASSISKNFSSATDVSMPEGEGTVSFASYASVVKSIYEAKWQAPDDAANDQAITKVSVTIARDGRVVESHVVTPSGDSKVDASVRRTLSSVKFIREFPPGAKESEKTFIINFNLQAKRSFG
jgi:TonB family protein